LDQPIKHKLKTSSKAKGRLLKQSWSMGRVYGDIIQKRRALSRFPLKEESQRRQGSVGVAGLRMGGLANHREGYHLSANNCEVIQHVAWSGDLSGKALRDLVGSVRRPRTPWERRCNAEVIAQTTIRHFLRRAPVQGRRHIAFWQL
jgi:hypothetical protein